LPPDLPVEQAVDVVEHQVLVVFYHRVGLGDAEVDAGAVDLLLDPVLLAVGSRQFEVLLEAVDRPADEAVLVIKEAQLQKSVGLSLLVALLVGDVEQVLQVLDGVLDVTVLGVDLGELFVRLAGLGFIIGLLAEVEELVEELYGFFEVAEALVDVADLLVALGLLILVLGALGGVEALLEKL